MPSGKCEKLVEIFDQHFDDIYSYVAYRVAPNLDSAQDITQEVFLGAVQGHPNFRGDSSALNWLRSIARRKVADHFSAQRKAAGLPRYEIERLFSPANSVSLESQGQALLVSLTMRQLSAGYAELLEEKYIDNLSVKEMARRRDLSEKAVESRLSRAREAFRRCFQGVQSAKEGTS